MYNNHNIVSCYSLKNSKQKNPQNSTSVLYQEWVGGVGSDLIDWLAGIISKQHPNCHQISTWCTEDSRVTFPPKLSSKSEQA